MNEGQMETTDIYQGAFLLCKGGDLSDIQLKNNGTKIATFLITGNGLEKHARQYRTGQALVNPIQLRESLNHLRDKLFETLRKNERRYDKDGANKPRRDKNRR